MDLDPYNQQQQQGQKPGLMQTISGFGQALPYAIPAALGAVLGSETSGRKGGGGLLDTAAGALAGVATTAGEYGKAKGKDEESEAKLAIAKEREDIAEQRALLTGQGIDVAALRAQNTGQLQQAQIQHMTAMNAQLDKIDALSQQRNQIAQQMVGLRGQQLGIAKAHLAQIDEQIRVAQVNAQSRAMAVSVLGGVSTQKLSSPLSSVIFGDEGDADALAHAEGIYGNLRAMPGGVGDFLSPSMYGPAATAPSGGAAPAPAATGAPAASAAPAAAPAPAPKAAKLDPNLKMLGLSGPPPKSAWGTSGVINGYRVSIDTKGGVKILGRVKPAPSASPSATATPSATVTPTTTPTMTGIPTPTPGAG